MRPIAAVVLVVVVSGCGYTAVKTECPACTVISRHQPPPSLSPDLDTVYILVPGILGFGWEWDEPLAVLRAQPRAAVLVFEWSPWSPLGAVAEDLARAVDQTLARPPLSRVVVLAHSAGGLAAAHAAALLHVPAAAHVDLFIVGAPYAGMHVLPMQPTPDLLWTPLPAAIGGEFRRYPTPAPRVTVESWMTAWPPDDVMKPRFGHDPGDPRVGPPGVRHAVPPGTDHNRVLLQVVREVVGRRSQPPLEPAITTRSRPAFLAR